MNTLMNAVEPALSFGRAHLKRVAAADLPPEPECRAAHEAVRAARSYLELQRPPVYRDYRPDKALAPLLEGATDRWVVQLDPVADCVGDPDQVRIALGLVLDNTVLESDAVLLVELGQDEEVPVLSVELDGPGRFADPLSSGGYQTLPLEALRARWTAATRGGRIDRTANGLSLRFKGVRVVPESSGGLDAALGALRGAEDRLSRLLKAALAAGQGGRAPSGWKEAAAQALQGVEEALAAGEAGLREAEPANLCALVEEAAAEARPGLEAAGVAVETLCDRTVPPIVMVRERIHGLVRNAFLWAGAVVPAGGYVSLLVDYQGPSRTAGMVITYDGLEAPPAPGAYLASMRRAVEEAHDGTLAFEPQKSGATVTITLPDLVGKRLDDWIPHWDRFSDRSRQMLRLLKSGGPTPPADFLLEGILEEELERWLLPRLEAPSAVNLAHELAPAPPSLPGLSPERLEKALDQVRRRKVKKEIARPPYAAELLWAFRVSDRARSALGVEGLSEDRIRSLCLALASKPPAYVVCLQVLAESIAGADRG